MISISKYLIKVVLPVALVAASSFSTSSVLAQSKAQAVDNLISNEAVEKRVKGMITENLDLFLTKEDYRVFATAKIKKYREKVVLSGELESNSSGKEKKPAGNKGLPGFSDTAKKKALAKKVDRKEKSRFAYRNRTKLTSLNLRLVLNETLDPKLKDLAVKTTKESLTLAVGKVGKFELVEIGLVGSTKANGGVWGWFTSHLDKKGGDAIDLLYLSLLGIGFLAALFALILFFRSKRSKVESLNNETTVTDVVDQKAVNALCSQKMDELISLLNSSPLITRNFLQNLNLDDKKFLYRSLRTPSLQDFFGKVLKLEKPESFDRNRQDSSDVFETILIDLKRYILLNKVMESKPFGYLPVMTGSQIAQFIGSEKDRSLTLFVVAPYLAGHQVGEVTKMLSVSEKSEFIAHMRDDSGELIAQSSDVPQQVAVFKEQIETKLRESYERIRNEAVVDISETSSLETAFLESDVQCIDVIKNLAAKHGKIPSKYEKYLVGFEDLLGLDLGIGRRVMERVSNEVLIIALSDTKMDSNISNMLGDMRTQLIKSLMKRETNVSKEEIETAKNEVLRLYRASV